MTSEVEQLLGRLRRRAHKADDADLRQAVALLLDARQQLAEIAAERDRTQQISNRLRQQLSKLQQSQPPK
ncbi:MAG: hypothetical protein E6Q69_03585 [Aquipseudomonas alcaligenes]|uniref:Uncharacterized protein n=1 Tax=Aquipseudomonas alcaligenes TaxID=43263 RepID=A0A5C7WB78_AQUAC|nr:MAG: hypothetical protein E6Q69_03585 [Pseudomonas alcaligenes]